MLSPVAYEKLLAERAADQGPRGIRCFCVLSWDDGLGHPGYQAVRSIPGVGPVIAGVFIAEIWDVSRLPTAGHLASWCGLTPRHRESDTKIRRGRITKQGDALVRWAAVQAAHRTSGYLAEWRHDLAERRGVNHIATVAAAPKIVTLAYYGMRDGHIRCLQAE